MAMLLGRPMVVSSSKASSGCRFSQIMGKEQEGASGIEERLQRGGPFSG